MPLRRSACRRPWPPATKNWACARHWNGSIRRTAGYLILDNVEDRGAIVRFVPEGGGGHVLITSRDAVFAEIGIPRGLEVRDLESDEAVRFLFSRTGRDESNIAERTAATALAVELGYLPLALEQAAAYVGETNARFSAYLEAFRTRRIETAREESRL